MRVIPSVLVLVSGVLALPYVVPTTSGERSIAAPKLTRDADEVVGNIWSSRNPSNDPLLPRSPSDADEVVGNIWSSRNPSNDPQI